MASEDKDKLQMLAFIHQTIELYGGQL